ncbi:MAG TPA: ABC-type transport auxiliary lipoprotein family protein [Bryobacteraceae bacterium]|nr:ABC-type transport auxiliary lipoprotein family protein [Bryobacteraceae bacterium]HZW94730.1 ABC-type transport auxiliary lipoprotein family protein [Candidatus Eremiobacteraceae bacterium]
MKKAIWVLLLVLCGCGGKIRYPRYYALEIHPPAPSSENGVRFPGVLAVRRFETPAYLRRGGIVYRRTPKEIAFYDYHRWAENPGDAVTTTVIDALRSSRLFSAVKRYDGQDRQDYLMTGRLERLDEIDYGGSVRVDVRISAELTSLRESATLWTGEADATQGIENHDVNGVVMAMSRALQKGVERMLASLEAGARAGNERAGFSK